LFLINEIKISAVTEIINAVIECHDNRNNLLMDW